MAETELTAVKYSVEDGTLTKDDAAFWGRHISRLLDRAEGGSRFFGEQPIGLRVAHPGQPNDMYPRDMYVYHGITRQPLEDDLTRVFYSTHRLPSEGEADCTEAVWDVLGGVVTKATILGSYNRIAIETLMAYNAFDQDFIDDPFKDFNAAHAMRKMLEAGHIPGDPAFDPALTLLINR